MKNASRIPDTFPGISEEVPWPQGDHSIFVQHVRPEIAKALERLIMAL